MYMGRKRIGEKEKRKQYDEKKDMYTYKHILGDHELSSPAYTPTHKKLGL